MNEKNSYKLIGFPLAFQIWAYDCFDKFVGIVCYKTASKIPHILNYFCGVSPYFEELEKNVFEADKNAVPTIEEITKYRLNELPKRVQQLVLESLGNVAAAHNGDDDFVDNPSKDSAPPKVSGPSKFSVESAPFTSKSSQAKASAKKLGIDVVSCPVGPINQVVDHSPNVVGDDDMGMAHVPCFDNEIIVEDVGNNNVSKNILMDIDIPIEEDSKVNDDDKVDVSNVDIITDDVINPSFIHNGDLLEVESVDSINKHKDAVKDGDEEGKNAKESKEEEKEDNEDDNDDNDDNDERKHEENDKDDKDDPDKGAGKTIDKFSNDGKEDETDGSDNIADKGYDNSSKDGNEENIDICDPTAEKFYANEKPTDPFEVYMVEGLPEQQLNDCSVFVIAYAKYFIHDMLDELKKNFQVQNYRNKLSVELYMHRGKSKLRVTSLNLISKDVFPRR
ncbi:Ulp1 protease family, C-terminal catalytic domain containing protein [Parasponia andersonii]|uniref:Ulp1 protease family, C-terminal catalytic domain containing protein n=1 Tax=Parasponia andersonii TaxID=3476 RepID=A0A2P5DNR2_PARAD|nr:Ulp1 protease family, C-terminal catalytic domain containing protein [Parasponia andersonii]